MQHRQRRDKVLHPLQLRHQQDEQGALRPLQLHDEHLREVSISIDRKLTFLLFSLIQVSFDRRHLLPLSTSAHNILHSSEFVNNTKSLRTNSSTTIVPGEVGGSEVLLVGGVHGLPGGLDLAAAVSQPAMPQALGREPTHLGDDVLLRHFCRRSLLCRSSEGRFQFLRQSNSSIRANLDLRNKSNIIATCLSAPLARTW